MLRHAYFNFIYLKNRKSTWIMLAMLSVAVIGVYILLPYFLNYNLTTEIQVASPILLILFATIASTKALNIFKDSEVDGTELMIFSKPLTRFMILSSKFLSLLAVLFVYVLSQIPLIIIGAAISGAAMGEAVGGFIVFGLISLVFMASISILLSIVFGTVGTMATTLMIAATLTTVSYIIPVIILSTRDSEKYLDDSAISVFADANGNKKSYFYTYKTKDELQQLPEFGFEDVNSSTFGGNSYVNAERIKEGLKENTSAKYIASELVNVGYQLASLGSLFKSNDGHYTDSPFAPSKKYNVNTSKPQTVADVSPKIKVPSTLIFDYESDLSKLKPTKETQYDNVYYQVYQDVTDRAEYNYSRRFNLGRNPGMLYKDYKKSLNTTNILDELLIKHAVKGDPFASEDLANFEDFLKVSQEFIDKFFGYFKPIAVTKYAEKLNDYNPGYELTDKQKKHPDWSYLSNSTDSFERSSTAVFGAYYINKAINYFHNNRKPQYTATNEKYLTFVSKLLTYLLLNPDKATLHFYRDFAPDYINEEDRLYATAISQPPRYINMFSGLTSQPLLNANIPMFFTQEKNPSDPTQDVIVAQSISYVPDLFLARRGERFKLDRTPYYDHMTDVNEMNRIKRALNPNYVVNSSGLVISISPYRLQYDEISNFTSTEYASSGTLSLISELKLTDFMASSEQKESFMKEYGLINVSFLPKDLKYDVVDFYEVTFEKNVPTYATFLIVLIFTVVLSISSIIVYSRRDFA